MEAVSKPIFASSALDNLIAASSPSRSLYCRFDGPNARVGLEEA